MTYQPHGKHLIAGTWVGSDAAFNSQPATGPSYAFSTGTVENMSIACAAAADAFKTYSVSSAQERALFLRAIADEIEARGEDITHHGSSETGLPKARLEGERARTVLQLRLFADHILKGDYLDRRHDAALPDRKPLPRPDLKLMQRPVGPVGVFGASNFPLAFSTAGGDTAAALAAGCPVVVKGHSAHPATGEIVADAVAAAVKKSGIHPGVFSMIQGGNRDVGQALVLDEHIKAIGFTGSTGGGRALFNLANSRPSPIPFFGELGSVNPMFLLPAALAERGDQIALGWVAALTMGAGQFCTNPGIAVALEGADIDKFEFATIEALRPIVEQTMLTDGIAEAYRTGVSKMRNAPGAVTSLFCDCSGRAARPTLLKVSGTHYLSNAELEDEVFGPLGILVVAKDFAQMLEIAEHFQGQLTATLHMDQNDMAHAKRLVGILEHKAGRILANGFPTGVEVCDAMVHGGPYPASTNFGASSVGTLSIRRFLRPVCYQNIPDELLPGEWNM